MVSLKLDDGITDRRSFKGIEIVDLCGRVVQRNTYRFSVPSGTFQRE